MFNFPNRVFYFVRHGVTEANQKKLWCGGDWDIELHADGLEQANSLSEKIYEIKSEFDRIYSSPMLRAKQTAQAINTKALNPVEIVEDLREWRIGKLEKNPWTISLSGKTVSEWINPEGGETVQKFKMRVINSVSYCMNNAERPLIVSHGAFCRVLMDVLNIPDQHIENCVLYKISSTCSGSQILWELEWMK